MERTPEYEIRVRGLDETINELQGYRERLKHLEPAMRLVASFLRDTIRTEQFDTEGTRFGTPWSPTKEEGTRGERLAKLIGPGARITRAMEKLARHRQILVKTGTLRRAFYSFAVDNEAHVYNPTEYASYHQDGTSKMVARPFMPPKGELEPEDDARVRSIIREWVLRG